jgi:hypothetical protein
MRSGRGVWEKVELVMRRMRRRRDVGRGMRDEGGKT